MKIKGTHEKIAGFPTPGTRSNQFLAAVWTMYKLCMVRSLLVRSERSIANSEVTSRETSCETIAQLVIVPRAQSSDLLVPPDGHREAQGREEWSDSKTESHSDTLFYISPITFIISLLFPFPNKTQIKLLLDKYEGTKVNNTKVINTKVLRSYQTRCPYLGITDDFSVSFRSEGTLFPSFSLIFAQRISADFYHGN